MTASERNEFDDFFGDEEEDVVDTRADGRLLRVPLPRMAPNCVNPRTEFGTEEELQDFGLSLKRRQIQAVPVVTRSAYLKLWPEHEDQIGSVDVVIVSGERRYRAASTVSLPSLECVINDDLAASKMTFLDAVVSENIDRANFDPVEEAYAVQALVDAFGTGRAVAQHYQRADGWVSQRRILLELAPEVLSLVRRRDIPLEFARKLGKLTKDHTWNGDEQLQWWTMQQQARTAAVAERKAAKAAPRAVPPSDTRRPAEPPVPSSGPHSPRPKAIPAERKPEMPAAPLPGPEHQETPSPQPASVAHLPVSHGSEEGQLPSRDPERLAELINTEVERGSRKRLIALLLQYNEVETAQSETVSA